jgi:hypothetical protein
MKKNKARVMKFVSGSRTSQELGLDAIVIYAHRSQYLPTRKAWAKAATEPVIKR